MLINVFKFGGASVKGAEGVRNVADILENQGEKPIVAVISAMGKTTNALETLLGYFLCGDAVSMVETYHRIKDFHFNVLEELFQDRDHQVFSEVEDLFRNLRVYLSGKRLVNEHTYNYDFEYDQIVVFGELISSCIVFHFLLLRGLAVEIQDARDLIRTDSTYRDANVNWKLTKKLIRENIQSCLHSGSNPVNIVLTQGFIGRDSKGYSTTLGREGSDFSAAILAFALQSKEVTIWKDVPGVMNADPKWMKQARKLDLLSYREAIELAYFGASILHPKTIKPLENANIRLRVKSFLHPEEEGTLIENLDTWEIHCPIFIRKKNQVLLSVSPKDFSFIQEENLSQIFAILTTLRVKVNVMQNSAISFSICVDGNHQSLPELIAALKKKYKVRYNDGLELITIRHYHSRDIQRITRNKKVFLEQKTRNTVHLVVSTLASPLMK